MTTNNNQRHLAHQVLDGAYTLAYAAAAGELLGRAPQDVAATASTSRGLTALARAVAEATSYLLAASISAHCGNGLQVMDRLSTWTRTVVRR